ncbi:hypothetical protein ACHAW6_000701 [Cyclotella cf. meneghiniana]
MELVPLGNHCCAAKAAIRNFKVHFLSVLAGTAKSFPMYLWDRLLPQTEITLNLIGAWDDHSGNGWYLYTSPEQYQAHNCHIKATKIERLTDTIQFKHKNITNPTVSHHDKIMHALANCKASLEGLMNGAANQQLDELQTVVSNAQAQLKHSTKCKITRVPRAEQSLPRVETTNHQMQVLGK